MSKRNVSRRQFLNYTLTGVGGFMAAGMLMPMVRFAIDPALAAEGGGDFIATKQKITDLTTVPSRVDFSFKQVDGWYESEETNTAWVYKKEDGTIVALSPICKHLGCTVNWGGDKQHPTNSFALVIMEDMKKDGEMFQEHRHLDRWMYFVQKRKVVLYLGRNKPKEGRKHC